MANFLSGSVLGGAAAVVVLGAASVLLPGRPDVAAPAPSEAAQPADVPADVTAEGVAAELAKPEQDATPKEALLDPAPEVVPEVMPEVAPVLAPTAEPATGAKTLTPPAADAVKLPESQLAPAVEPQAEAVTAPDAPKADTQKTQTAKAAEPNMDEPVATEHAVAEPAVAETAAPLVAPAGGDAAPAGTPPLEQYAAKFDNPGGKPLFAVILFDTGAADVDRAALAALDFPVTFAIDPESANAAEAMAIYRKAGKEVVMLPADLPQGATAQDLEQNFQTYEAILPEAVAVMGTAKGGFQDNASLAKLIVPVVQAQGRGLITFDRGLNAAAQGAQRVGLAHGEVFRQVDGSGESVPVIRRYLDRAVFNAAQDGGAMVMGQTAPDTITALMEWSVEGRASDVTLAPASALLKVQ